MNLVYNPQTIVNSWCKRWDIEEVPNVEFVDDIKSKGIYLFEKEDYKIQLSSELDDKSKHAVSKITLLHELRHHYQRIKFRDVSNWWFENVEMYEKYYGTPFCVVEEDARIFSRSFGEMNGDVLLKAFQNLHMPKKAQKNSYAQVMYEEYSQKFWRIFYDNKLDRAFNKSKSL